jgi:uncharacterized Zn finger protein
MGYAKRFDRKPFKFPSLNTKGHWLLGVVWPIIGSKGDPYEVELVEGGFKCSCTGFTMHGKCKHIQQVWDRLGRSCEIGKYYEYSNS